MSCSITIGVPALQCNPALPCALPYAAMQQRVADREIRTLSIELEDVEEVGAS